MGEEFKDDGQDLAAAFWKLLRYLIVFLVLSGAGIAIGHFLRDI